MKKIFLVSHGKFAEGLKMSAEMICGEQKGLYAKCMLVGEHPSKHIKEVESELSIDGPNIILADLFGGSMCNEALKLSDKPNTYVVAGMNLPLLIEILFANIESKEDIQSIITRTKDSMKLVEVSKESSENEEEDFF